MSKFSQLNNLIIRLYNETPEVASDDKLLLARVWHFCGWNNNDSLYNNLKRVPSAESITRARRKLVEQGYLKPTEKATETRYEEYKKYRDEYLYR